jgi:hypothetical protein
MGKVASKSIMASLRQQRSVRAFHVHLLSPENMERRRSAFQQVMAERDVSFLFTPGLAMYRNLIQSGRKLNIITLIREPISRNISAFFQNLDFWHLRYRYHDSITLPELIQEFLRHFPHEEPLTWFDDEFRAATGINVYDRVFPKEKGYQMFEEGRVRVLVMRHDLDDRVKGVLVGELVGIENFAVTRDNSSENKAYADVYRKFCSTAVLPASYISEMLDSKYVQHFFPASEIEAIKRRWLKDVPVGSK